MAHHAPLVHRDRTEHVEGKFNLRDTGPVLQGSRVLDYIMCYCCCTIVQCLYHNRQIMCGRSLYYFPYNNLLTIFQLNSLSGTGWGCRRRVALQTS